MPTRLIILGSTGSIGTSTLDVVAHLKSLGQDIEVIGVAAHSGWEKIYLQTQIHNIKRVAISDSKAAALLRKAAPHLEVLDGEHAATQLVELAHANGATDVAASIVGFAGLRPTLRAAELGLTIHLSNKETLVAAGALFISTAKKNGTKILPVDSEHAGAFQCISNPQNIAKLVLTASGGALRDMPLKDLQNASATEALQHPTWKMGQKVTIDSATMMNKVLEMIEAHWLFNLPATKLDALLHPQSIVHALVSFVDGSTLAQLANPDMRVPIQAALTHPRMLPALSQKTLDPLQLTHLEFAPLSLERYPAFALAKQAIRSGGTSGAILNGANEVAVEAFVAGKIKFGNIAPLVEQVLNATQLSDATTLEAVIDADKQARAKAHEVLMRL